jgi:hypothetical protein
MNSIDKALTVQLPHELELHCPYSIFLAKVLRRRRK